MTVFRIIIACVLLCIIFYNILFDKDYLFLKGRKGLLDKVALEKEQLEKFEQKVGGNSDKRNLIEGIISFSVEYTGYLLLLIALFF